MQEFSRYRGTSGHCATIEDGSLKVLGGVLVLSFEVKLDLNVVGVAKENLPTGAVGHLIHAVGHALVGKVPLHRLEAVAAERDMIDDG
jgi:hypothetical protein